MGRYENTNDICLSICQLFLYIFLIIYTAGDIELNPGPTSDSPNNYLHNHNDSSTDMLDFYRYKDLLTFSCLNIQSLLPKKSIVEAELGDRDIILLTETWLKSDIADSQLKLDNFKTPYRDIRMETELVVGS